jgi:Ca2+-transporting ATPase
LKLIVWSVSQGVLAFAIAAAVVIWARATGMDIREVRSLAFFSLVAMIVALILANRSFNSSLLQALTVHNRALQLVLALVVAGAAASLLIPPLRTVLTFAPVSAGGVGVMGLAGGTVLVLVEITKRLIRSSCVS